MINAWVAMINTWAAITLLASVGALPEGGAPTLESIPTAEVGGTAVSENGYYQINWYLDGADEGSVFVLEQSTDADFAPSIEVYRGTDRSTTFSGRQDGTYFYRVKCGDGRWSQPLTVVIQHHSLKEALIYMVAGGVVFLSTAALVLIGHIQHRREQLQRKEGLGH